MSAIASRYRARNAPDGERHLSVLIARVALDTGVAPAIIENPYLRADAVHARTVVVWAAYHLLGCRQAAIGDRLGKCDRTTIAAMLSRGRRWRNEDADFYDYTTALAAFIADVVTAPCPSIFAPTRGAVIRWVINATGVSRDAIEGPSRSAKPIRARFLVVWGYRRLLGRSYADIGQRLGGRDHSTIISAFRRAERLVREDQAFASLTRRMTEHFDDKAAS